MSLVVDDSQRAPSHNLIKPTNRNHAKVIAKRKLLNLVDCDREGYCTLYFILFNTAIPLEKTSCLQKKQDEVTTITVLTSTLCPLYLSVFAL